MDYSVDLMVLFIVAGFLGALFYKDKPSGRRSEGIFDYFFGDH